MTIEHRPIAARKINGYTITGEQAVVHHDGSVGVYTFVPEKGTAWVLFQDHSGTNDGEPGRPIPEELMGPRQLDETPGVLLAFTDPRSIDVVIEALVVQRRALMEHLGWDMVANTPPKEPGDKDTPPSPAIVNTGNC